MSSYAMPASNQNLAPTGPITAGDMTTMANRLMAQPTTTPAMGAGTTPTASNTIMGEPTFAQIKEYMGLPAATPRTTAATGAQPMAATQASAAGPAGTAWGGQPTTNLPAYSMTNQQQGIAGYAQPYVGSMLGATMGQLFNTDQSGNVTGLRGYTPYSYNPADYFAAATPLQQQSYQAAGQMQTPGQYGMGTQAANAGILSALGAGNRYGQMATDPYATAAFMSPYYQNVVDTQMQQAKRQADIAGQTQQAQAAKSGAFGGARDYIQRSQANADLQRNLANIQATGSQNAYTQAQQAMQNVANLGLQGAQAGITGAGQLGQLGAGQLAAQTGIANLQNQYGQQQQALNQNVINQAVQNYQTAQQYPYMQLGFMQNMLSGLPLTTQAQQTYQQPPSMLSQLAGAGTSLLGLNSLLKDSGGIMGGLSSLGSGISSALGFADGGEINMADGGTPNPASGPAGQLAYNNEPVLKMASGGIAELAMNRALAGA